MSDWHWGIACTTASDTYLKITRQIWLWLTRIVTIVALGFQAQDLRTWNVFSTPIDIPVPHGKTIALYTTNCPSIKQHEEAKRGLACTKRDGVLSKGNCLGSCKKYYQYGYSIVHWPKCSRTKLSGQQHIDSKYVTTWHAERFRQIGNQKQRLLFVTHNDKTFWAPSGGQWHTAHM